MKLKKKHAWWKAFCYAGNGISATCRQERNMKVHFVAALFAFALAYYYGLSRLEWCVLLLTIMGVLVSEVLNTAIERIVDFVSPEVCPAAKLIKDLAAGAVLIAVLAALGVGYLLFFDRIFP